MAAKGQSTLSFRSLPKEQFIKQQQLQNSSLGAKLTSDRLAREHDEEEIARKAAESKKSVGRPCKQRKLIADNH